MKKEKKIEIGIVTFIVVFSAISMIVTTVGTDIPTPYALGGHITDTNGNPIIGAEITITNVRTGDSLKLKSIVNGEYQENAGNFLPNRYQDGDTLRYHVKFGDIKKVVYAKIDESHGGTLLDIQLDTKSNSVTEPANTSGFCFPVLLLALLLTFLYIQRKQINK